MREDVEKYLWKVIKNTGWVFSIYYFIISNYFPIIYKVSVYGFGYVIRVKAAVFVCVRIFVSNGNTKCDWCG